MSFLARLKETLNPFEEVPDKGAAAETEDAPETPVRTGRGRGAPSVIFPKVAPTAAGVDDGTVDDFLKQLRAETASRRSAGHTAFYEKLDALVEFVPDPGSRYKAALKTAKGVTAKDLLASITAVETALGEESKEFEAEIGSAEEREVIGARAEAEAIDGQIETLNQQLGELRAKRTSLAGGISNAERKYAGLRAAFSKALGTFKRELDAERTNITTHLG
ncbi:MAG TPA: hypothetical protein VD862_00570 [Candidatus Paceibacterota bacterium]|nr:hypothetical protein [Candidatus Paceibacterota bacterium]